MKSRSEPLAWSLPLDTWPRAATTLRRAMTRRCPYCGGNGIYDGFFALRETCPHCGTVFEREEGYFLGAFALNLIVAEVVGLTLAIGLLFGTGLRGLALIWQELIAVAIVVALPILFFPYSRGAWMAVDLVFHPPLSDEGREMSGVVNAGTVDKSV